MPTRKMLLLAGLLVLLPRLSMGQDLTTMLSKFLVDLRAGAFGVNQPFTSVTIGATTFAALPGTPTNGTLLYCSDCAVATPCVGAGTGAIAEGLNGAWACGSTGGGGGGTGDVVGPAGATDGHLVLFNGATGKLIKDGGGLGTGVLTFLGTPSSGNFASALTNETGTGSVVFNGSPTFTGTPVLATPSGASTIQVLTLPAFDTTNNRNWYFSRTVSTNGGDARPDESFNFGYNLGANRVSGDDVAFGLAIEAMYIPGAAATAQSEMYVSYIGTDGTSFRPWGFAIKRDSQNVTTTNLGDYTSWNDRANVLAFEINNAAKSARAFGTLTVDGSTTVASSGTFNTAGTTGAGRFVVGNSSSGTLTLFIEATDVILGTKGAHIFTLGTDNGREQVAIRPGAGGSVALGSAKVFGWSSNTNPNVADNDTAFARVSAGLIEINNGTAGTIRDLKLRHSIASGTAPTIDTGCGTGTLATGASDGAGKITTNTTGACTIVLTFGVAWPRAPSCHVNNETTANLSRATTTTTTATFTGTTVTGDVWSYSCDGY